ncbi:MAG: type IV toxin-antitoxin system AbiEi family antitoxin domain-containing protein [Alphaproteobacteria bacterium]|nr:type IV toxin-antitoxin system AbiEi family antitoxin domain-containing protein [Alphaproteobacteria bacterium]
MPSHKASQAQRAQALLAEHGMLRLRELTEAGIGEETLSRLVRQGSVIRPSRGLYQAADAEIDAAHSLAEAAKLVPKGVICLISALQYHELTTQLPSRVWVAISRAAWKPSLSYPPIRIVRFADRSLDTGVETHMIEGVAVRITSVAKTVVDCFRYRNKIGTDVALEALREGLRKRRCSANALWKLARELRILSVMRPYLESAASDGA